MLHTGHVSKNKLKSISRMKLALGPDVLDKVFEESMVGILQILFRLDFQVE